MTIVPASSWLEKSAQSSELFRNWPIVRIPHVIDCAAFSPLDMQFARATLGLPLEVPLILFLASAGIYDERKGWDLLDCALPQVKEVFPNVKVIIVGPPHLEFTSQSGVPIHWHGIADGDETLRLLYNASNIVVVPSREDNMPLTALEAQTCGRPVVAFRTGGLVDIVDHQTTGYLAEAFSPSDLSVGIQFALINDMSSGDFSERARHRALSGWSAEIVSEAYRNLYREVTA